MKIKVKIDLNFFLRIQGPLVVSYHDVCTEGQLSELRGQKVEITFLRRDPGAIDKSEWSAKPRSTVVMSVETAAPLLGDSKGTFAIRNCLDIINKVITSYQGATGEISNAGFIVPLGTSDMQLFAEILVDGQDFRDRWPSYSFNTVPLSAEQLREFNSYLTGLQQPPLDRLFLTNARLALEQGRYPLAVLQAATAVELRITAVVSEKLRVAGWSEQAIEPYERLTLGQKLQIPFTDTRSLETYFNGVSGFDALYKQVRGELNHLRNRVAHRGYLVTHDEAIKAVRIASKFLKIVVSYTI